MAASLKATGRLRLNVDGVWTVKELVSFFDRLRDAYAMLLPFLPSTEELEATKTGTWKNGFLYPWPGTEVRLPDGKLFTLADLALQALRRDPGSMPKVFADRLSTFEELMVDAISISSPGWVDLLGRLNPLQTIHDIIVLIRDWREKKQRARVENSILELEGIRQRIQILRDAGFPDHQIQEYVQIWLTPGTHFLVEVVNQGRVVGSSCTPMPVETGTAQTSPPPERPAGGSA